MDQVWAFLSIFIEPDAAVFFWHRAGYPLWLTFILLSLHTSLTITLVFYGTGWIKNSGKIRRTGNAILGQFKKITDRLAFRFPFLEKIKKFYGNLVDKTTKILHRGGIFIIFIASCIPFVPVIPTAAAAAAKLVGIKHGLIVILLGTAIRNILVILGIYYGIPFLFN